MEKIVMHRRMEEEVKEIFTSIPSGNASLAAENDAYTDENSNDRNEHMSINCIIT